MCAHYSRIFDLGIEKTGVWYRNASSKMERMGGGGGGALTRPNRRRQNRLAL